MCFIYDFVFSFIYPSLDSFFCLFWKFSIQSGYICNRPSVFVYFSSFWFHIYIFFHLIFKFQCLGNWFVLFFGSSKKLAWMQILNRCIIKQLHSGLINGMSLVFFHRFYKYYGFCGSFSKPHFIFHWLSVFRSFGLSFIYSFIFIYFSFVVIYLRQCK